MSAVETTPLSDMSSMAVLPAVGRPLQLGMLYDCRSDAMIPGFTLWDLEAISKDQRTTERKMTEFTIIASDSLEARAAALDVPASFKASLLCGLADASGAAKYLRHAMTSKKQARVTLKYSTTTRFDQLTMTHLKPNNVAYSRIFQEDIGTHVVVGVLYGAQAFCIFDRELSSSETMNDTYRELAAAVKKIPVADTGVPSNIVQEASYQKISCTYYGDYSLKKNLSTFEEANDFFKSLPLLPGLTGDIGVALKVWLYPLQKLSPRAPQVTRSIRYVLIEEIQAVLQELSDIDIQCEDLLNQPAAMYFRDIKSKIQRLRNLCKVFRLTIENSLSKLIPSIRRGDREESKLADLLSRLHTQQVKQYIESLEKEAGLVSVYCGCMKGSPAVSILSSEEEMNHVLWDPKVEFVILFMFTSLHDEEPHLSALEERLQSRMFTVHPAPLRSACGENATKWFDATNVNQNTRAYVTEFIEFASGNILSEKVRFFVSTIPDPDNPGASIYLYEKGVLKSSSFRPPRLDAPAISSVSHDSVQLTCAPCPDGSDQVIGYRVEFRSMRDHHWTIKDGTDTNRVFTVTGLLPNCLYQFRQSAVLARWVTCPSDPTAMIKTLPCSPPGNVNDLDKQPTSITLSWEEPGTIGSGTQVTDYKIEFLDKSIKNNTWREVTTGKKSEAFAVQGLEPNSSYRFRVSAVCENAGVSAPSDEYIFTTLLENPNPPEQVICTPVKLISTPMKTSFKTSFKMDNGMYWTSTEDGIHGQDERDQTCVFEVCPRNNEKVEIKDYQGNYLCSSTSHSPDLIHATARRDEAMFQFELQYEKEKVFFRACNGLFLSRIYYINTKHTLEARKKTRDVFCLFEMVAADS